ncbi:uncharacterized protein TNCV_4771331 [Trichonephila clavipes]|nr:uncharacterized protein TNCV_4771331 [Trichonephila clavipes]
MRKLGLMILNGVPCYCHLTPLPTVREALNTTSLSICRSMWESGHLLTHSISNVLSCCKPPTTYWFLNLRNEIKVTERISSLVNGHFDLLASLPAVPLGLGSNLGEDMDVYKWIGPSWQGSTLNSRQAASLLVRLMGGVERWETPDYP